MKKYIRNILSISLLAGFSLALSSCQDDEGTRERTFECFTVYPVMKSAIATRASHSSDKISVVGFVNGDQCGFYSERGNRNDVNKGFTNQCMVYKDGTFNGPDMNLDINNTGHTLLYYPYSSADNGRQPVRNNNGEAIDLLLALEAGYLDGYMDAATGKWIPIGGYSAVFNHVFSMLILIGGEGFENFMGQEVSVTVNKAIETVEFINTATEYPYVMGLQGTDDKFKEFKGHEATYNDQPAYYVIIPNDGGVKVESINVRDNAGKSHRIQWTPANGKLENGTRYPLTLKFDEHVPTVYPHEITPWDSEPVEIEANKETGIGNLSDFRKWMLEYNKESPNEQVLGRYGDKVVVVDEENNPTDVEYWRFHITADIDLTDLNNGTDTLIGHIIRNLKDVLDGGGHTLSGLSLKGDNAAFINTLTGEHACLSNLVIDGLKITTKQSNPAGAVVTRFESGKIENCRFTDLAIDAVGSVGALAGTIGDATVSNCSFSGVMYGTRTVSKIIGEGEVTGAIRQGCDVSNVMFGQK